MKQKLNRDNVLSGVKLLTGLKSNDYDEKLLYIIDLIIDKIKDYINYTDGMELPARLEKITAAIVVNALIFNDFGIEEIKKEIQEKAITRGDTKIEFSVPAALPPLSETESMKPYLRTLNRYKRVQMR